MRTINGQRQVKTIAAPVAKDADGYNFVMSSEEVDREGDVIRQDGWSLTDFRRNPIALAFHNHEQPIGRWSNVGVRDGQLKGTLHLGDTPLAREIGSLIDGGILKAVSVGFMPGDYTLLKEGGIEFVKDHVLLESSVVSIPAAPSALIEQAQARGLPVAAIAKALNLRPRRLPAEETFVLELVEDDVPTARAPASDYQLTEAADARTYDPELWDEAFAAGQRSTRQRSDPREVVEVESDTTPRQQVITLTPERLTAIQDGVRSGVTDFLKVEIARRIREITGRLD